MIRAGSRNRRRPNQKSKLISLTKPSPMSTQFSKDKKILKNFWKSLCEKYFGPSYKPARIHVLKIAPAFFWALLLGAVDPNCTVQKVCVPNYDTTVRPPSSYTMKLKKEQMEKYKLPGDPASYEEDHVIPLVLCGAPKDEMNLNPQPWDRARKKDVMEVRFHKAVCKGEMTLEDAQKQIVAYE